MSQSNDPNDFYVGYISKAPPAFAQTVKITVATLLLIIPLIAFVLAKNQQDFPSSQFEFGSMSQLEGIVSSKPVPNIKIINGKDIYGNTVYQSIPMVSFGKFGAESVVYKWEKELGKPLHELKLTIEGTLIYRDGKSFFELTNRTKSLLKISNDLAEFDSLALVPHIEEFGSVTLQGEIVDPKCYFGVMKPGEGKPHKACAIRCISGGVPPVFVVTNERGESNYYLIRGENGQMINQEVLDYIAEPVTLRGSLAKHDDWFVVYVNPKSGLERLWKNRKM